MEIEIEMTSKSTDMLKVLQKVTNVINSAREQGFVIKDLIATIYRYHQLVMSTDKFITSSDSITYQ